MLRSPDTAPFRPDESPRHYNPEYTQLFRLKRGTEIPAVGLEHLRKWAEETGRDPDIATRAMQQLDNAVAGRVTSQLQAEFSYPYLLRSGEDDSLYFRATKFSDFVEIIEVNKPGYGVQNGVDQAHVGGWTEETLAFMRAFRDEALFV